MLSETRSAIRRTLRQMYMLAAVIPALSASAASPSPPLQADDFNPGVIPNVRTLALQPDGKILTGGNFYVLGEDSRYLFGRLNSGGTLDRTYPQGTVGGYEWSQPNCIAVQTDGRIWIAGDTLQVGYGPGLNNIGRVGPNGAPEYGFPANANGIIYYTLIQRDGKLLVGGAFNQLAGQPCINAGRLNQDGTLDTNFLWQPTDTVSVLALQPDGKILAAGPSIGIIRLNQNGTPDLNFGPVSFTGAPVFCLVPQPDGKILVGGQFTGLAGYPRSRIGRLNADGTCDTTFDPGSSGANGYVLSFALQTDGKILVAGVFSQLGGQPCNNLGRLNTDGTFNTTFDAGVDGAVASIAVQPDGKILAGGVFGHLGGQERGNIGRLNNTGPASQSLAVSGSTVTWLRGGTSPEVWRTAFDYSTNGADWIELSAPARTAGGWQVTNVSVPTNASLRARGFVFGGPNNGSSWFVQTVIQGPAILDQPIDQTVDAGGATSFTVVADGNPTLGYQWREDGTNVVDGVNVSGATGATLSLSHLLGAQAGSYSVVVSNSSSTCTSSVATLIVVEPIITEQPANVEVHTGQDATFAVGTIGTQPVSYQWFFKGNPIDGATAPSLVFTQIPDTNAAGSYFVVVSNIFGSITSTPATLTIDVANVDAFNPGADADVSCLVPQADGKILVGGRFTTMAGQPRNGIARVSADGSLDATFNPGAEGGDVVVPPVSCMAVQPDGKILVGGGFATIGGQSRSCIARLNNDGTLDTNFTASVTDPLTSIQPVIYAIIIQTNGQIVIGGRFNACNGQPRSLIARLNADGTLDSQYDPGEAGGGTFYPSYVYSLALQSDGKIVAGGFFSKLGGTNCYYLGRVNVNGSLDTTFTTPALWGSHSTSVSAIALQPDGGMLLAGLFPMVNDQPRGRICRLYSNGDLDLTFNPQTDYRITSFALQADGKILLGGSFTTLAGHPCNGLARINSDGSLDQDFSPGANDAVAAVGLQADGKILVAGAFTTLCGQNRNYLGRLENFTPATNSLGMSDSTLMWLRSGASPELSRASFESSTDGTNWTILGNGTRIPGGWNLTGVVPPASGVIRARGYVVAGYNDGSAWQTESLLNLPQRIILLENQNLGFGTNGFGFNISGLAGQTIIIESSSNLLNWLPLWTNTLLAQPLFFSDRASQSVPRMYYRARVP